MKFIKINELLEEIFNTFGWAEEFFEDCPEKPLALSNRCHIGLQCSSSDEYEHLIKQLWKEEKIISENVTWINGRRISVVKFTTQSYNDTGFKYFEISDQKEDMSQHFNINHAEIVFKEEHNQKFKKSQVYKFIKQEKFKHEFIKRPGYKKELCKVTLPDGFIVWFSQGEFLYEKISQEFLPEKHW